MQLTTSQQESDSLLFKCFFSLYLQILVMSSVKNNACCNMFQTLNRVWHRTDTSVLWLAALCEFWSDSVQNYLDMLFLQGFHFFRYQWPYHAAKDTWKLKRADEGRKALFKDQRLKWWETNDFSLLCSPCMSLVMRNQYFYIPRSLRPKRPHL